MAQRNPGENARAVAALETAYRIAAGRVLAILSKLGPASRSGAGPATLKQVEGVIRKLDRTARAWTEREIPAIYRKSRAITTNRLALFGEEKNPRFEAARHDRAAQKLVNATCADLAKANRTILRIAKKYVSLVDQGRRAAAKLQALTGEEGEKIGKWAAEAVAQGETSRELQIRIMEYLRGQLSDGKFIVINGRNYKLSKYSDLVASARLREAASDATINAALEYDHDLVEIPEKGGSCEECVDIEGEVYSLSGTHPVYPKLTKEETPPIHPRCFLPGTRCVSPSGFIAGSRATFRGEVLELTFADGTRLSVTPNHMLLTPHGFAAANLLRKGDDVFYSRGLERILAADPDANQLPTTIEDVFRALQETPGMASTTVPHSAEDLHGDGRVCDGDIDIVGPDGFLGDARKSATAEHVGQVQFGRADLGLIALPGLSDFAPVLERLALAADGIVGGLRAPSPFFRSRAGRGDSRRLAGASFGDAQFREQELQPSVDHLVRDAESLGDIAFQHSRLIQTQKLARVDVFFYHGFIYDLQTPTSLYFGNGIVSTNCRHYVRVVSESSLKFREAS